MEIISLIIGFVGAVAGLYVYRTQNFKVEKIRSRLLQIKNSSTLSLIIGHGVYDALITVFASALL